MQETLSLTLIGMESQEGTVSAEVGRDLTQVFAGSLWLRVGTDSGGRIGAGSPGRRLLPGSRQEVTMDRTGLGTVTGLGEIRLWNDLGANRIFNHLEFWGRADSLQGKNSEGPES